MYYDERIQGGIFTPVLVVTDRSIFVELEVMNRSILIRTRHVHDLFTFYLTPNDPVNNYFLTLG